MNALTARTVARAARLSPVIRRLVATVLAAMALASAVGVGILGWQAIRAGNTQRESTSALNAAETGITQVLTYSSSTLDADMARARQLVSGSFAAQYEQLTASLIVPASRQQSVATKAEVVRAAVIDAQPDRVQTLLYVNQATTTTAQPQPHAAINQVRLTMTRSDGRWLISELQPV